MTRDRFYSGCQETTGSHRLVNNTYDIDFSFDNGVKVWSERMSITMNLEYMF